MLLVRLLALPLLTSLLAGCPAECEGTSMTVQNLTSMAIPGISPETTIEVGDINIDIKAEYIRVLAETVVLVEKNAVEKGDVLPFTSGGKGYELRVDRIEHHITSTDYAHLCVSEVP